jgi:transketolase
MEAMRDAYGRALLELGTANKKVVVLTADLGESTRVDGFARAHPERFVECGVAEQNMVGIAAGLALSGRLPFVNSFAVFCPGRTWDQLRISVCYNKANVKIVGCHAGLTVGADGASHQALEDIAAVRCIPDITVVVPCDAAETAKATKAIAAVEGPCYMRINRQKSALVTKPDSSFSLGKASVLRNGGDVAIVACGIMVHEALVAAEMLAKEGMEATVINNHTVKPIDATTLLNAAQSCGCMVTAEEHQINGGMGSAVLEAIASAPVPVVRVGVRNVFGESGTPEELLAKYGLTAKDIAAAARQAHKLKYRAENPLVCKPPNLPVQKASQMLAPVSKDVGFNLHGGRQLHTLVDLHRALLGMDEATFAHHCTGRQEKNSSGQARNDFANWIEHVHDDPELAASLRKHSTRAGMARAVGTRISQLYDVVHNVARQ